MELFNLDKPSSEEFLEVYKVKQFIKNFQGVVPEYLDIVEEFTKGASIALEVRLIIL